MFTRGYQLFSWATLGNLATHPLASQTTRVNLAMPGLESWRRKRGVVCFLLGKKTGANSEVLH